jgi:RNA-binding protein YhbY
MLQEICTQLNAGAVQHIGKILVVYQPQEEVVEIKQVKRRGKPLTKKQLGSR